DQDGSGSLPGGLMPNQSLTAGNSLDAFNDFSGIELAAGAMVGGDRVLRVFEVDSAGFSGADGVAGRLLPSFDMVAEGVEANGVWAVYWFPTLSQGSNIVPSTPFEIGGFQQSIASSL